MSFQLLSIHDLKLYINKEKGDFSWYQRREVFEERLSPLYELIQAEGFTNFVDVGANYGMVSLIMKSVMPSMNVISIEADPTLSPIIKQNFELNNFSDMTVINAVVSDSKLEKVNFSLNPKSTLDNRVAMTGWEQVSVPSLTLDSLVEQCALKNGKTFFKIDTQGFEYFVLRGGEKFFINSINWMIKMEFAPNWLKSQKTNPEELLRYLVSRYEVTESPARVPFCIKSMDDLFKCKITDSKINEFIAYIEDLNQKKLGWVDLLVRPKTNEKKRFFKIFK